MKKQYKTSLRVRQKQKAKRDAIKAAGGAAYADMLAKVRTARAAWRLANPEKYRENRRRYKRGKTLGSYKSRLVMRAKQRGRKIGLEATVKTSDIYWPTYCPVLGIELDYSFPPGGRKAGPSSPSLDRWDNTKGYVSGNVYVISLRANTIKSNATADELVAVAKYAAHGPPSALPPVTVTEIVAP